MDPKPTSASDSFNQAVFAATVHRKTLDFFDSYMSSISPHPELKRFIAFARSYVGSGKALRALGVSVGNYVAGGEEVGKSAVALELGAAIELYQSSALVHDDLIDNADMRRGIPSVHKQAELALGAETGAPVAILVGDFLLSLNQLATVRAALGLEQPVATKVLDYMAQISAEVAWGQYLDVITEQRPLTDPESLRQYVRDVIALKSGHYSVMRPLVLGALLQTPAPEFIETLEQIGRPWGVAFQMRDDAIGVFGDEDVTGKPTGSDIREGKRTILITLALAGASETDRYFLEEALGNPALSEDDLARCTDIIISSGANDAHEEAIKKLADEGNSLVDKLGLDLERATALRQFGSLLLKRDF